MQPRIGPTALSFINSNLKSIKMRKLNSFHLIMLFIVALFTTTLHAQQEQNYLIMTTHHIDMNAFRNGGTAAELDSLQQLLTDVYAQNPLVVNYTVVRHAWGSDNSQFIEMIEVKSWDDIDKFSQKNQEIMQKKFGEQKMAEMGPKYFKYFNNVHHDEIYHIIAKAKKS